MTDITGLLGKRFKELQKKLKRPFVFFDLETTGINPKLDRIVEITMIKITKAKVHEPIVLRMNPGVSIPEGASEVHGIYDKDVADLDGFEKMGKKIAKVMTGADYAGYNAKKYDVPLLQAEFDRHDIACDLSEGSIVDPLVIFKTRMRHNLTMAVKFYTGKAFNNAHNSLADTVAALEVLSNQLDEYDDLPVVISELATGQFTRANGKGKEKVYFVLKDGKQTFNFGKHKGKTLSDVPSGYLDWMLNRTDDPFPDTAKKIIQEHLKAAAA